MTVRKGSGITEYGPGVVIELSNDEAAVAIHAYLVAHNVHIYGPATVTLSDDRQCQVYVDPSGFVVANGNRIDGR